MKAFASILLVAVCFGSADAQSHRFSASTGPTVSDLGGNGLHLVLSGRIAAASPLSLRVDGMFEQTDHVRHLYALGNLVLRPWAAPVSPYVIGGAGAYFDNGVQPAFNGGIGVDLSRSLSVPLFVEYRILFGDGQRSALSVGVAF